MLGLRWWLGWWLDMGENPPCFFYVFFCLGGVFLWGERKRKEWKRSFFGRRNLILFLFFFVFLGHFRILVFLSLINGLGMDRRFFF